MNVSQAIPDDVMHFRQAEPEQFWLYKLATKNFHLATIFLQLVAKRWLKDFFNFEPCLASFFAHDTQTSEPACRLA